MLQGAKQLEAAYPSIKCTVWTGSDATLFKKATATTSVLDIDSGVNIVWLDWMKNWGTGAASMVDLLSESLYMFARAWEDEKPGLLYVTLKVGQERDKDRLQLSEEIKDCTEIDVSKHTRLAVQGIDLRAYGIAAQLQNRVRDNNIRIEIARATYYRGAPRAASMLLLGFKIYASSKPTGDLCQQLEDAFEYVGFNPGENERFKHDLSSKSTRGGRRLKGQGEPTLLPPSKSERQWLRSHAEAPPWPGNPEVDLTNPLEQQRVVIHYAEHGAKTTMMNFNLNHRQLKLLVSSWTTLAKAACESSDIKPHGNRKPCGTVVKYGPIRRANMLREAQPDLDSVTITRMLVAEYEDAGISISEEQANKTYHLIEKLLNPE